ncbi:hypothetical protein GWK47_021878 [Chionoecetes opilio]|uniref:Uncharacterized protein n=1 Tax=Chionoecetes opilio TaxID=41210 RepID=A0A8J4XND3_CHIOP|nr:hypothetical protein GWK47_021878 [Chionoecetes opilio]
MKEEIFQRIVKEMKALIRQETEERDNSQDMETMEEHEEVSADPFAELCDTTQADQEDDLEEDIKKELLAWKRSKEATLKKSHFQAKLGTKWCDPLHQVQHWDPKLSSSGAINSASWGTS